MLDKANIDSKFAIESAQFEIDRRLHNKLASLPDEQTGFTSYSGDELLGIVATGELPTISRATQAKIDKLNSALEAVS